MFSSRIRLDTRGMDTRGTRKARASGSMLSHGAMYMRTLCCAMSCDALFSRSNKMDPSRPVIEHRACSFCGGWDYFTQRMDAVPGSMPSLVMPDLDFSCVAGAGATQGLGTLHLHKLGHHSHLLRVTQSYKSNNVLLTSKAFHRCSHQDTYRAGINIRAAPPGTNSVQCKDSCMPAAHGIVFRAQKFDSLLPWRIDVDVCLMRICVWTSSLAYWAGESAQSAHLAIPKNEVHVPLSC